MSDRNLALFTPEPIPMPESQTHRNKNRKGALVYYARRPHQKSRTGCANCKRRKVKCDETRPNCHKCQIYGISCAYSVLQVKSRTSPDSSSAQGVPNISVSGSSMSLMSDLSSRISQALELASSSDEQSDLSHTCVNFKTLRAFHHFLTIKWDISTFARDTDIVVDNIVQLAFQSPYMMHAILSVAITNLRQCLPDNTPYEVAESYHCQNTLRLYRKELVSSIGPHNMDLLISTYLMINMFSFSTERYNPADSWVFSSDPTALNWLLVQRGFRYLLAYTAPYLEQSIWHKIFREADDEHNVYHNHTPGREGLHPGLADLCGIDETTTENDNPYHWPLRMLSPMLKVDVTREYPFRLTSFIPRLSSEFISLLLQKDSKALVILSYWFAKMCELKLWWIPLRASLECMAICMYLENSEDTGILKLLEFPAESCGYLLRHVREEAVFVANFELIGLF